MKRVAVVLFALAACDSKSTAVNAGADGGPKASPVAKPKAHVETSIVDRGSAEAAFHVHSRFPAESEVEMFPLDDGIAVVQWADKRNWKLSTVGRGKAPRALSGRITRDEDRGELVVRGSTSQAFALQRSDGVLYRATSTETKRLPNRFTHVVELRPGQWIGLEVMAPDESIHWDFAQGEYKRIDQDRPDAGLDPSLPVVPPHLRARRAISIADGKICADATTGNPAKGGIWTADVGGQRSLAPFAALDLLFRGPDGACQVLDRNQLSGEVHRVKGDDTQLVAELDFRKLGYDGNVALQADREGGLWFIGPGFTPWRIVVTDGVVTTAKYPLPDKRPEKLPEKLECAHPTAMRVVAVDANDVWVLAACRDADGHFLDLRPRLLMHTGPDETVYDWPAP